MCEESPPQLGIEETFMELIAMAMATQPVERGRLPEVWFRIILGMSLYRHFWIAAQHTV
jgi:hypothetical protein